MINKFLPVTLQPVETVEELRKTVEKSLNASITAFNRPSKINNASNKRVTLVGWPTDKQDAVSVEYLESVLNTRTTGAKQELFPTGILPSGTNGQTLRYDNSTASWIANSKLKNDGTTVSINNSALAQYSYAAAGGISLQRANGSEAAPTKILSGETIASISISGYGSSTYPTGPSAKIDVVAAENFDDTHGGSDLIIYTTPKLNVSPSERIRVTSEGKVGVNDTTPTADFDLAGGFRSTGFNIPADGEGIEVHYTGSPGVGYVQAYDRAGSAYRMMQVSGLVLRLNAPAACGNVLVKTNVDNADGGVLQVKGNVTPNVDKGGDLGTDPCQWKDIRYEGSLYSGGNEVIDQFTNGHFYKMYLSGLSSYANNAAALAGGKVAGEFYTETGSDPLKVCIAY